MTKIFSKKGVLGFAFRIGISALRLYFHIGRIYAIIADSNKLGDILLGGLFVCEASHKL